MVFVAYYSPEQYEHLLKLADDREKLNDKWEDWLLTFLKLKSYLEKEFIVEDFHIDVCKMHDYFKLKKLKNNGANRANYTREEGMNAYKRRVNNLPEMQN